MASLATKLSTANETAWMRLGSISELMHDPDKAMFSYENALRHNPYNVKALTQIASICRLREQYPKAVEYFQRILNIENNNGEIWGALGHCYLMMDDLQKAYTAYQQALYHLPNPKDPNLWYGIGILYDRYGSFEHAEEAFTAVLKMDPKFEKSNEIYFRLGIIYKQQLKYEQGLDCFRYILQKPPRPLTQGDIWFQIGHVYELQKDFNAAKDAYERVLKETPNHAKALQQLGWLYHSSMSNQEVAISYLMRSIDADPSDGQTWYLLGRCYMAQQQYRKAYDAYQQAVYRDGRNPTFWCSIGVLYYQINQYRDALDAYSRAIRLNPYLSEVWYDLGTLYESCNQISDSLDAYQRAAELDPGNKHIQQRLNALREQTTRPPGSGPAEILENNESRGMDKEKTPMIMEPRAQGPPHANNERPMRGGSPGRGVSPQGVLNVPDLVDLSNSHDTRTLPSTNDLNTPPKAEKEKSNGAPEKEELKKPETSRDSPSTPTSDSKDKDKDEPEAGMEIIEDTEEQPSPDSSKENTGEQQQEHTEEKTEEKKTEEKKMEEKKTEEAADKMDAATEEIKKEKSSDEQKESEVPATSSEQNGKRDEEVKYEDDVKMEDTPKDKGGSSKSNSEHEEGEQEGSAESEKDEEKKNAKRSNEVEVKTEKKRKLIR